MGEINVSGGCQCGAVRYTARASSDAAYWCHCRMCQRALGNVAAAFVNVLKADVVMTGPVAHYMSSPFGRRGFCAGCGTPLTFDYPDSEKMDLTVGSLDDPAAFAPTSHFGVESRHGAWIAADGLPENRADDYAPLLARWERARGETG
jgi:hypothetical protein